VQFRDQQYKLRPVTGVGYEAEVYLRETFKKAQRAFYASGTIAGPTMLLDGTATAPIDATGQIDGPTMVISGDAQVTVDTTACVGQIQGPTMLLDGDAFIEEPADYYVTKTGLDSNPGTYASPFLTIQHALDSCAPGDTIAVYEGTYNERLVIAKSEITLLGVGLPVVNGTGGAACLYSGGVSDQVTIKGMAFTNAVHGIESIRDADWVIRECSIYNCEKRGVHMVRAVRHRVVDCTIYEIGDDQEAFGVYTSKGTNVLVEANTFRFCRKNAVREIGGSGTTVARNYIYCCGTAIAINQDTHDANIHHNYTYHCPAYGVVLKRCVGGALYNAGYNRAEYNTFEDCGDNAISLCQSPHAPTDVNPSPMNDYIWAKRNLLKNVAGSNFLLLVTKWAGPHIEVDENMYWIANGGPINFWDEKGGADELATLAAVQAQTAYETNGVMYSAGAVSSRAYTVHSASSGAGSMDNVGDWAADSYWQPTSGADEWVILDLGASVTFDWFMHHPFGHKNVFTVKNIRIQVSDSAGGGWSTEVDQAIQWGGSPTYMQFAAPVTKRYVRFYIDDNQGETYCRVSHLDVGYLA
jgi:hypothetical protein